MQSNPCLYYVHTEIEYDGGIMTIEGESFVKLYGVDNCDIEFDLDDLNYEHITCEDDEIEQVPLEDALEILGISKESLADNVLNHIEGRL